MELEAKAALCFRGAATGKEKVIFEKMPMRFCLLLR
jgi:hypothetical protein